MFAASRVRKRRHMGLSYFVLALLAISFSSMPFHSRSLSVSAQENPAQVRLVHGVGGAGPLDIYVDGGLALIGIVFGETSSALTLPAGEHDFAVVPTGASPDEALADGTINLRDNTAAYAALLGTSDATSVGLFRIDSRPLDAGRARFRIISGVPDAEAIVPVFTGGEALSQPLSFGDASEYATIDAGTYDLEMLDNVSGASLLAVPGTEFAEGTTTDVILVGQLADASVVPLVVSIPVEVRRPAGRVAQVAPGTCDEVGEPIADLGLIQPGQGEAVGVTDALQVAQGYGLAAVPFATLTASPHVVTISEDQASGGGVVACGPIGGQLTDTGALVIGLEGEVSHAADGVAVLAPAIETPDATGISVFLIGASASSLPASPTPNAG